MDSTRQGGRRYRSHRGNVVVKSTPDGTGGSMEKRITIGSAPVALPDAGSRDDAAQTTKTCAAIAQFYAVGRTIASASVLLFRMAV
jgi:hypothetical protein